VAAVLVSACGSDDKNTAVPAAGSRLNEACEKTADCAAGLACVVTTNGNVCRPVMSNITVNAKECAAIQCSQPVDCCDTRFTRWGMCSTWASYCATNPTTYAAECRMARSPECVCDASNVALLFTCDTAGTCHTRQCDTAADCCATAYHPSTSCYYAEEQCALSSTSSYCSELTSSTCLCDGSTTPPYNNYSCVQNQCVTLTTCTSDTSCPSSAPRCDPTGHCVACLTTDDCAATDAQCIANACVTPACKTNADCPAFSACEPGTTGLNVCVRKGCANDRECMTYEENYLATCNKSVTAPELPYCVVQCDTDSQCATSNNPLRKCVVPANSAHGTCQDPGCDTDEECKIRLELNGQLSAGTKAVCRDKVVVADAGT
jgi:hypothetical protein